jgi:sialate O-acetylesterase
MRLACASLVLALGSLALAQERQPTPIRVACLGDSITFGAKVDAKTQAYPVQLQQMLGDKFLVRNFGVGGATMIRHGKPNAFQQLPKAKEFQPHIVIVNFGINDTRGRGVDYWEHSSEFIPDARALIDELAALPTRPQILLCLPTANIADLPGMPEERRANVGERLERLANVRAWLRGLGNDLASRRVSVVDLEGPTREHPELFNIDGVHLKPAGYRRLAELLEPEVRRAASGRSGR